MTDTIRIEQGLNGPHDSANGGVAAGSIAALVAGPATVRLLSPPPMGVDLTVTRDGEVVTAATQGGDPVLTAAPATPRPPDVPQVDLAAVGDGVPFPDHPADACVVCGPEHSNGLRVFPAPVEHPDTSVLATWWTPPTWAIADRVLREDLLWGVLDCPGALAIMHAESEPMFAALGTVTAKLLTPVRADQRVLVLGWASGSEGRKRLAGTAVLDEDGTVLAHTTQVCIAVPTAWAGAKR